MSERRTYTWRGVKHSGVASSGQATIAAETMAMTIERYWRAGWPSLTVKCGGAEVGGIKKQDGKRVWWAEADTACAFCGRFRAPQIARYDWRFCDETCARAFDTIPQPAPQTPIAAAEVMPETADWRALARDQEPASAAQDCAATIPRQATPPQHVRVTAARQVLAELPEAEDSEWPWFWIGRLKTALEQLLDVAAPAPADLDAERCEVLAAALADASSYREGRASYNYCADCKVDPARLCADHAADLDLHDAYVQLATELGIELDR